MWAGGGMGAAGIFARLAWAPHLGHETQHGNFFLAFRALRGPARRGGRGISQGQLRKDSMKSRCALPLLLPFAFAAALSGHSRQARETKEPVAKEGKEVKVLSVKVLSCEAFDRFLEPVNAAGEPAKRALVDDLVSCAGRQGTPLLERGTKPGFGRAGSLYRGPASKAMLSGDLTGLPPTAALTQIAGTVLYYLVL